MTQNAAVQAVMACSQCGRALAQSDLVQIAGNWVCAECKPAFLSRVMASGAAGASPQAWRYGGVGIRFGARLIDGIVLGVPLWIGIAVLSPGIFRAAGQGAAPAFLAFGFGFLVVAILAGAVYEILMLKNRGATLGKMACGLKVVRSDGGSLSWGVCVGRFCMWNALTSIPYLNFIIMMINAIMVGVDGESRALHDRVCDTRVIYK